ncbi:serine/threonine protein kinase, partial [Streptomyces sp. NPDC051132]
RTSWRRSSTPRSDRSPAPGSDDPHTSCASPHPDGKPKNGEGDLRFDCATIGCELKSDSSVFVQIFGGHGTTLDECRLILQDATKHTWTLSAAAAGSEFCIRHPSGDIALFVVQTKSTAVPEAAFLEGDLTIWRHAA